jgi:heat shock protein HslJ
MAQNRIFFSILLIVILAAAAFFAFSRDKIADETDETSAPAMASSMPAASDTLPTDEPSAAPMGDLSAALGEADEGAASVMPSAEASLLMGKRWLLVRLSSGETVPDSVAPDLILGADGMAKGFAGCNQFSGTYKMGEEGAALSFPDGVMATEMACAHTQLEMAFLKTLPLVTHWRIDNDQLNFLDGNGGVLASLKDAASLNPTP